MKSILGLLFLFALMFAIQSPPAKASPGHNAGICFVVSPDVIAPAVMAQEDGGGSAIELSKVDNAADADPADKKNTNWGGIALGVMGIAELAVRLTPSKRDNSIFNWLAMLVNAILPNLKKGGGTFKVLSE